MISRTFARRLRARESLVGYWSQLPVPAVQERVARHGYDYVCFDAQHGFLDYRALLDGLIAVDAGAALSKSGCAGLVRVIANNVGVIGQALDAGAEGVIVPLVDTPEQARAAVEACRFPPKGVRSYGPMRASLRSGPVTADMNDEVACVVMIETREGLANLEAIAAVEGVDGLYVGPADLMLSLGGRTANDEALADEFEATLARIAEVAERAGIAAGIHTNEGTVAARRLAQGYTFASISSDLNHLDKAAAGHLRDARA
ncbi:4-hydroxy-2-oxoheptanedioate aldolase [Faunimonas pinastri]|uniref:4-hydroxy-2-oxoheptanedioate aldolase n=1 Tax=Faunimonas pinastri TaxID=1855383 RepID=A0A1H9IKF8_9HYPH|nr:aldolase/citrate lyase family protein [Faunimonas pinastri]SEQ75009.1 4-hydroxy-2-oxoheptanedioate aldolase [Faunimonas pinastri]